MKHDKQISLIDRLFRLRETGNHEDMLDEVVRLPASIYTEQSVLDDELSTVFKNFPMIARHISNLSEPGSYILSDWEKFPYVIVRDNEGRLRGYLNSCRHRGAQLVSEEEGNLKAFVCPFHGWSYDLDGNLKGVTRSYNFPDLDKASCSLREFPVKEKNGLIWIHPSFDASIDIDDYLGSFSDDLANFDLGNLKRYTKAKVTKKANWKLLIKTYLEGYHVPYLHRDTLQFAFKNGVITYDQNGPNIRFVAARTNITDAHETAPEDWHILNYASVYYCVFPNTFVIMHPDYVSINSFFPAGPDETVWTHEMLYRPEDFQGESGQRALEKRFRFTNDAVFDQEDFAVTEGIQSGINFEKDQTHILGLEEGLLGVFQRSVDGAIKAG
ncbi:MAG: aromatic ring-hydroxylating dioxygenase subunit alpha [Halospina sp.]